MASGCKSPVAIGAAHGHGEREACLIKPYVILGACNPGLAHQAISLDPTAGLLLPCNVVLTVEEDGVVVSAASPLAMFQTLGQTSPTARIAEQAEQQLRRAIAAL